MSELGVSTSVKWKRKIKLGQRGEKLISKDPNLDAILAEYNCLRQEILQKMDSCWKIITFEAGGVSLILGYVFVNSQYSLLPLVPFLILVTSFLYMGETLAIMNAGTYIRLHTETKLKKILGDSLSPSWESYAYDHPKSYWLIHLSTYFLFAGLFWATIIITIWFKLNPSIASMPFNWATIILFTLIYSMGFIVNLYVYAKEILSADIKKHSSQSH
ncbi:MAG TPA: hypothetical protein VLU95_03235 [Candidatus Acidoferrum sp.]|nr:hypothetical protein [Candidatus Acidoferrum sp.]